MDFGDHKYSILDGTENVKVLNISGACGFGLYCLVDVVYKAVKVSTDMLVGAVFAVTVAWVAVVSGFFHAQEVCRI